eukprot:14899006-Ditylum_brightwellii.AAC.1
MALTSTAAEDFGSVWVEFDVRPETSGADGVGCCGRGTPGICADGVVPVIADTWGEGCMVCSVADGGGGGRPEAL